MEKIIPVRGLGTSGASEDMAPQELPLSVWSSAENVLFVDGKAINKPKDLEVLKGVNGQVLWAALRYNYSTRKPELVYVSRDAAGTDNIYLLSDDDLLEGSTTPHGRLVSRTGGYTPLDPDTQFWNGFVANGCVVLTNGVDAPQVLQQTDTTFKDLPGWPAGYTAKAMGAWRSVWVAMNVHDPNAPAGYQDKPTMLMYSTPIPDIGQVPTTWEPLDANNQPTGAGFLYLNETDGEIVTGEKLGDYFIVYKTDSIVRLEYTGSIDDPFHARTISFTKGALGTHSVLKAEGVHFVIDGSDIYRFNGEQIESLIEGKYRKTFDREIGLSSGAKDNRLAIDTTTGYLYVFTRTAGSLKFDKAHAFAYKTGTWSRLSLGEVDEVQFGSLMTTSGKDAAGFDNTQEAYDTASRVFDKTSVTSLLYQTFYFKSGRVYVMGQPRVAQEGASCVLKKHAIDFDEVGITQAYSKSIVRIWPLLSNSTGYLILKIWGHRTPTEVVPEENKRLYVIDMSTDERFDVRVNGKYISMELIIDTDLAANWNQYTFQNYKQPPPADQVYHMELTGLDIDLQVMQER